MAILLLAIWSFSCSRSDFRTPPRSVGALLQEPDLLLQLEHVALQADNLLLGARQSPKKGTQTKTSTKVKHFLLSSPR